MHASSHAHRRHTQTHTPAHAHVCTHLRMHAHANLIANSCRGNIPENSDNRKTMHTNTATGQRNLLDFHELALNAFIQSSVSRRAHFCLCGSAPQRAAQENGRLDECHALRARIFSSRRAWRTKKPSEASRGLTVPNVTTTSPPSQSSRSPPPGPRSWLASRRASG